MEDKKSVTVHDAENHSVSFDKLEELEDNIPPKVIEVIEVVEEKSVVKSRPEGHKVYRGVPKNARN